MDWRADLPGAALLGGIFLGLLLTAELWRRLANPQAEWTRKLVHLGGGIACLGFPFLVHSPWVVGVMAVSLTALFAAGGRLGFLRSLHGVGRRSRGAEFYPLAVFLVFVIARDRLWIFVSSLLVLAVGDAFAALIGSRYGEVRYQVEDERKSLEGSLVFLVIAFLAIHLPLLLLTDLPRPICVLAALLVATLVTGFEAISLQGADNLFVPLATAVVLGKITSKPLLEVIFQNLSLLAICLLVAALVWRTRALNAGGTITFILFAYGAWSLGNWQWALPAFIGFAAYVAAWVSPLGRQRPGGTRVRTLARVLLPPFSVLVVANSLDRAYRPAYGPYLAASGAALAFALRPWLLRRLRRRRRDSHPAPARPLWVAASAALAAAALGTALTATVPWLIQRLPPTSLLAVATAVVTVSLVNLALERLPTVRARRPHDPQAGSAPPAAAAKPDRMATPDVQRPQVAGAAAGVHPLPPAHREPMPAGSRSRPPISRFEWPARLFLLSCAAAALVALAQTLPGITEWRPDYPFSGLADLLNAHS